MAASVVSLDQIPSLASLYRDSKLAASSKPPATSPSESVNNRAALIRGDLTKLQVDAIVNAANTSLLGGGGVDGAIHAAAGRSLLDECRTLGGCPTGESRITKGYRLPARHVIHTVGPVYSSDDVSEPLLRSCYRSSLELAAQNGLRSVAFSGISTGIYGYPSVDAAVVACRTVREYLDEHDGPLEKVVFVTFLQKDVDAYNAIIPTYFPPAESTD
ncbi:LRP16 family protein [Akanthomyces lecanii RCEF 1005]|uniref:LRP16 family protein n=1 Tax=Akanthomyces lecanii RCEF 1005 TaxID=1081108 RepID=A0A168D205_CORDF|nr:LRP16 family protein [Akanthomyces lecanii RCEF 1005]